MKNSFYLLASLFLLLFFSTDSFAGDVYAEYTMTGVGKKPIISKMFIKNDDVRTESTMDIGGKQMTTTILKLKSNPNVMLVFNSMNKIYTETKSKTDVANKSFDIKVIGNEKVGNYNCTHVRMSSDGKAWDMWYTKDLPTVSFPIGGDDALSSQKMLAQLKSKGITGIPVKISFLDPKTSKTSVTMLLTKFEQKTLPASLFTIPAGYTKSTTNFDAEKMKNMTPQQKKEMIMKMMKEHSKP